MNKISTERLKDIAADAGFDVSSYSGRGMYGLQCVSIRDHENGFTEILSQMIEQCDDVDEAAALVGRVATDSMGRGIVLYWPSAKWDEEGAVENES